MKEEIQQESKPQVPGEMSGIPLKRKGKISVSSAGTRRT